MTRRRDRGPDPTDFSRWRRAGRLRCMVRWRVGWGLGRDPLGEEEGTATCPETDDP